MSFPVLAFDLGASRGMASLVRDGRLLESRRVLTRRGAGAGAWLEAAAQAATAWRGRFKLAVLLDTAETGDVAPSLSHRLRLPVSSLPRAQAAAWGEHRFGAAPGGEMVFLHADWAVTGAIVSNGALMRGTHGLAGRLGQLRLAGRGTVTEIAGGARLLVRAGEHGVRDLTGLLAAASAGSAWAVMLLDEAAEALAASIEAVQTVLDPGVIVLGGAIGAAPRFRERLEGRLAELSPRPNLRTASLGPDGALLGAADYAARQADVLALPPG